MQYVNREIFSKGSKFETANRWAFLNSEPLAEQPLTMCCPTDCNYTSVEFVKATWNDFPRKAVLTKQGVRTGRYSGKSDRRTSKL
jgi:hypothetical protein